jgi:Zn-dependent metalloprotease
MSVKKAFGTSRAGILLKTLGGLSFVLAAGCAAEGTTDDEAFSQPDGPEDRSAEAVAADPMGRALDRGGVILFAPNGDVEQRKVAETITRAHIDVNLEVLGLASAEEIEVKRVRIDDIALAHTRVQQKYKGVPVFGGEAIVHLNRDGSLRSVTDGLVRNVRPDLDVKPAIGASEAVEAATAAYGCSGCLTAPPVADLLVFRHEGVDHLAYRVQLRREDNTHETAMPVIFVDAHSGKEIWRYDNLQTGSGSSLYSGTVTVGTSVSGTTYYLENTTKKIGTFDMRNGTSSVYRFTDTDDSWTTTSQRAAVDAHYGAEKVYDYFKNVHGRNGIDGAGGPGYFAAAVGGAGLISSVVHYSTAYNNAYWDGQKMTYGDGDGTTFGPLVSLDIAAHEMTHGVTQFEANLTYQGESGALNESFSDVFGALVERYVQGESANTWKIGETCFTPSNGTSDALRYMNATHSAGNSGFTADDDPDHYAERYTGAEDNGGVHINSGIANYAFYLAAKGGTHHYSAKAVTGMGADDAGKIWYKALADYMTASTNFAGARQATLDAATALFGSASTQYNTTATAWCAVGVGSCPGGTTPPPTGGTNVITNGGFETNATPWVLSAAGAYHTANGTYPKAGTGYAYLGNINNAAGTAYQQVTVPTNGTLTFWLNAISNETTTTTKYDYLYVEVRNTSGTLLQTVATYSNLDKTTSGTYVQKTLSLAAYAGQTVRLQFRGTTDTAYVTTFRIDEVQLK